MNTDTTTFFLIILGGVITVWSFRRASGRSQEIKEIEYFAFACLWGTFLVTAYAEIMKRTDAEQLSNLLNNPLASGLVFSFLGILVGLTSGVLERRLKISNFLIKVCKYLENKIFS